MASGADSIIGNLRDIDIIIIDIMLSETGPTGIEFIKKSKVMGSHAQTIYITGYDTYYETVYQTEHVYLLKKPIDVARIEAALEKAIARLGAQHDTVLRINTKHGVRLLRSSYIVFIESAGRIASIHTSDEQIETYGSLKMLSSQLPPWFVRTHKSYLVNLYFIKSMNGVSVELSTGSSIPVSQRRRSEVERELFAFVRWRAGVDK